MTAQLRKIVVVAEDHMLIRNAAADVLNDHGHEVIDAGCTEDALAILVDRGGDIGVLFIAISLPGAIDALTLVHRVSRCWPRIRILLTSGRPRPPASELPAGSRFLPKAYDTADLAMRVRELVAAG